MPKRTKADKWIYFFKRFKKLPSEDNFDSIYGEMTFVDEYCEMVNEDKLKVWRCVYNLKFDKNVDPNIVRVLLKKMYDLDTEWDELKYTDPIRVLIKKITVGPYNTVLIDLYQTIKTVPYISLNEFISQYKIYCWEKFKEKNLLKVQTYHRVIVASNLFDDVEELEKRSPGGINEGFEIEFKNYSYNIDRYIKKYGIEWLDAIYKNIQAFNDFLFCPIMLSSIINYLDFNDVLMVKGRIKEIEDQMLYLNEYERDFTFPTIIKKNLTKIRTIVQERLEEF